MTEHVKAAQASPELIEQARGRYASDDVEIDDNALCSESGPGGDNGVWVQAWVWVQNEEEDTWTQ